MPRVFLVEDESTIRSTLRDTVPWSQLGYEFVGEATDGEMALPLIGTTHPDVLITDIKMPFMDGLSLSKLVLKEFPNTKIIIISGYDDFEYARQAIEIGVEQYLLKPITKANLMNVLREVKEKIEQEQELEAGQTYAGAVKEQTEAETDQKQADAEVAQEQAAAEAALEATDVEAGTDTGHEEEPF